MSFFKDLLKGRERTRLEEAVRKTPSADGFARLAQAHRSEGDLSGARSAAKRGLAAFPADAALSKLEQELAVLERDAEIKRLREQIENFPNPRLYARLAELYRSAGDREKALGVARAGLGAYRDHGGIHYAMGLLLSDSGSTEEAVTHLSRAAELDKLNYAALRLLGSLLTSLGRHAEAADAYARIRTFAPDDEEVKALHASAARAGGVSIAPLPAARPAAQGPARKAFDDAPASPAVEPEPEPAAAAVAAAPVSAPAEAPAAPHASASMLSIALSRIVGKDGIEGAVLADAAGRPVASALAKGQDEAAAAAVVAELRRTSSPVCGEFGLGSFEEACFETASGGLHVFSLRELSLGIFSAPRSRAGLIAIHARSFAKKAQLGDSAEARQ